MTTRGDAGGLARIGRFTLATLAFRAWAFLPVSMTISEWSEARVGAYPAPGEALLARGGILLVEGWYSEGPPAHFGVIVGVTLAVSALGTVALEIAWSAARITGARDLISALRSVRLGPSVLLFVLRYVGLLALVLGIAWIPGASSAPALVLLGAGRWVASAVCDQWQVELSTTSAWRPPPSGARLEVLRETLPYRLLSSLSSLLLTVQTVALLWLIARGALPPIVALGLSLCSSAVAVFLRLKHLDRIGAQLRGLHADTEFD